MLVPLILDWLISPQIGPALLYMMQVILDWSGYHQIGYSETAGQENDLQAQKVIACEAKRYRLRLTAGTVPEDSNG